MIDLRAWNFDDAGPVRLNGQWRFSWHELWSPAGSPATGLIKVPSAWNGQTFVTNGSPVTSDGTGYGRYELTILLAEDAPRLHIALPEIHMASQLWINGELTFSAGIVGINESSETPKSIPASIPLPAASKIELVLAVSNHYHMEGGILRPIQLGKSQEILAREETRRLINVFTIGALMFLGLYYLVNYLSQSEQQEQLWYALLAFLMLIRLAVVNKLTYLLGDHSHLLSTQLSYTTVFLVPTIYIYFLYSLFPEEFHKRLVQVLLAIGSLGTLFVWLTPASVFTWVRDPALIAIQALAIYAMGMTLLACLRKREDSLTVLMIVIVFGATLIYDTLLYQRLIEANDISPFGFLIFIFGHAAILGRRSNRIIHREREARKALAEMTETLQSKVEARTADLAIAKEQAEQALMQKNRVLAATSHDLRQPLHALNLFVGMLETSIKQGTWPKAVMKITQLLQGLDKFMVDLGEVSRLQSGNLTSQISDVCLETYFEVLFDEFDVICRQKGVSLKIVHTGMWAKTDPDMLARILRNLVSNAVKYTNTGKILIGCRRQGDKVWVEVHDTGPGIPAENKH
ncbi:MAG: 7TM diverse intracellular signaling domain-containing protein [Pseudomonadales bacterium]